MTLFVTERLDATGILGFDCTDRNIEAIKPGKLVVEMANGK